MKRFLFPMTLVILMLAGLTGCNDDGGSSSEPPVGDATYRLTFQATWSAGTHPGLFPSGAHFSGLIGGTHKSGVVLWQEGGMATQGIKEMAEMGRKSTLQAEVEALIRQGRACTVVSGGGLQSPGTATATFITTPDCTEVTVVSMLAPSPDWFTGVSGLSLARGGEWVDSLSVKVDVYDAGTDSGTTFTSPDAPTSPRMPILPLTEFGSVGTFTFTRIQ